MLTDTGSESASKAEYFDTIVIGGGQAGLAVGYFLSQQGQSFIILDKNARTGDSWRNRWESLQLFTPSRFNNLPGMPFSKPGGYFPTKDEVADYLEHYARHFNLPVRTQVNVESISHDGQGFQVSTDSQQFTARNVIVATGPFQKPFTPEFAGSLNPDIFQLHSSAYRKPRQVPASSVLVVGAGNSGAEIAVELARAGKKVWLSGRDVGRLPVNSPFGKFLNGRPLWWMVTHLMTINTPMGRKMQATFHHGAPLGRLKRKEVAAAGVTLCPRLMDVQSGRPRLADDQVLPVDGVIWATGFQPDYNWIQLPIFDSHGNPLHSGGIVPGAPGLYFIGLLFQTGLSSSLLGGVGKDAATIASLVSRPREKERLVVEPEPSVQGYAKKL